VAVKKATKMSVQLQLAWFVMQMMRWQTRRTHVSCAGTKTDAGTSSPACCIPDRMQIRHSCLRSRPHKRLPASRTSALKITFFLPHMRVCNCACRSRPAPARSQTCGILRLYKRTDIWFSFQTLFLEVDFAALGTEDMKAMAAASARFKHLGNFQMLN
jgi:hypothetical protein